LLVSAYHLSESTVVWYWKALRDFGVEWLHGYPSFLALFAALCRAKNLPRLESVRWVTTAAENLLASQRNVIEEYLDMPVRQHYGMAESVANISERTDGRLVVDEDFSLVEFLAPDDEGTSRIIGTNWSNPAFPLFRYDTGDTASVEPDQREAVGIWREVGALDGRCEDYVMLRNGARIGRLDHMFKDLVNIVAAQIYQHTPGEIVLRVVKGSRYDECREEVRLLREARMRLGAETCISVEYVDTIEKTRSGKLRFVVSDVASGKLERVTS
jgi:phenylacetate-CoA ligase